MFQINPCSFKERLPMGEDWTRATVQRDHCPKIRAGISINQVVGLVRHSADLGGYTSGVVSRFCFCYLNFNFAFPLKFGKQFVTVSVTQL
jgi:hypothetical protein